MHKFAWILLLALFFAPALGAQSFESVGTPEGPAVPAGPAGPIWEAPTAILWDNGPLVTNPGAGFGGADASVLQTNLGLTIFGFGHALSTGFRMADDFTVTAPAGWNVTLITFFAYQTGSTTTSTLNHVNLRIWNGPPGAPGSAVVFGDTTTNRFAGSSFTNIYRVTDTALTGNTRPVMTVAATVNTTLPAGTYWLDWQVGGTLASGPWAPPVSILGQTAAPGANALQFDPTPATWNPALDGSFQQALPFLIEGQVVLEADLAIQKTGLAPAPGFAQFTLTVTNNGPDDATGVVVTDTFPAELAYVSDNCGGVAGTPWTWNVGNLAASASVSCTIQMSVVTAGTVVNTASVSGDQADPVPGNDSSAATLVVEIQQSVLEIPTLGVAGLAALALLLGVASLLFLRRRTA